MADDKAGLVKAIGDIFARHSAETDAILQRYTFKKNNDGCRETAPLTSEDQRKFIESRRFLLSAVRTALPEIVQRYPQFLTAQESMSHDRGNSYAYKGTSLGIDSENKYFVYALAFHPRQHTPIHSHSVGCVSYVVQGEMMETEYNDKNMPLHSAQKKAGYSTIVSPHPEEARFNRHVLFSSGLYDQNILLHIYDGLRLTEQGTVEDLTGNIKKFYASVAKDMKIPTAGGSLVPR